jgi:hypothetical protein
LKKGLKGIETTAANALLGRVPRSAEAKMIQVRTQDTPQHFFAVYIYAGMRLHDGMLP